MAVPQRRTSKTAKLTRRWPSNLAFKKKFSSQPLIKCSNCQELKMLHLVCSHCLDYKGFNNSKKLKKEEIKKIA